MISLPADIFGKVTSLRHLYVNSNLLYDRVLNYWSERLLFVLLLIVSTEAYGIMLCRHYQAKYFEISATYRFCSYFLSFSFSSSISILYSFLVTHTGI